MGQVFKAARERKRVTLSQAAIKTRIKIQHIEMMERDDFSQMPAPAYARGFIRMYADFLGLESGPLVEEYNAFHQPGARPRPMPRAPESPSNEDEAKPLRTDASATAAPARFRQIAGTLAAVFTLENIKRAGLVVAMILVCWLLVIGLKQCAQRVQTDSSQPHAPTFKKGVPAVVEEPADTYLPLPATSGDRL